MLTAAASGLLVGAVLTAGSCLLLRCCHGDALLLTAAASASCLQCCHGAASASSYNNHMHFDDHAYSEAR
uniref:Secreted protein n=1 Tax=Oryza brachyantha TaxID=4533 RepID=J3MIB1_ORYBR